MKNSLQEIIERDKEIAKYQSEWLNHDKTFQDVVIDEYAFRLHIVQVPYRTDRTDRTDNAKWDREANHYQVKISVLYREDHEEQRRYQYLEPNLLGEYITFYSQGSGIKNYPRAKDILSCIFDDALSGLIPSFEDFCSEFGLDDDSRKAEKMYRELEKVSSFFSGIGIDEDTLLSFVNSLREE